MAKFQKSAGKTYFFGDYDNADLLLMQMLIDDGVTSRSNRKNLLCDDYNYFAVAKGKHKLYGDVVVFYFAEDIKPSMNTKGESRNNHYLFPVSFDFDKTTEDFKDNEENEFEELINNTVDGLKRKQSDSTAVSKTSKHNTD